MSWLLKVNLVLPPRYVLLDPTLLHHSRYTLFNIVCPTTPIWERVGVRQVRIDVWTRPELGGGGNWLTIIYWGGVHSPPRVSFSILHKQQAVSFFLSSLAHLPHAHMHLFRDLMHPGMTESTTALSTLKAVNFRLMNINCVFHVHNCPKVKGDSYDPLPISPLLTATTRINR